MHELSLCESVIETIMDNVRTHHFSQVRRVRLTVGRFAGVETEALRFSFDVVARGTLVEGAELELLEEPGAAWCFDCSETVPLMDRLDPCPRCGGTRLHPTAGTDVMIKDLEVI
ncbi:hydrogenase maturation nickel metallochaperone HypA [Beijerinckia indica]|uniref:Hydrogenase maturation factor HypA n=1 Tax=Beijerinckia indica subsp. indica (strain ATCC 9039 / DSM 1715 / NCIMB 8712) TaxID=395963 RepID=HYPA_BEII9|nr:hydrogenase maturation nickel metallochaperone HypA [Beijerinckia indica]B2IJ38.1 RecName: Full=Hydrogenase maturation factor HypA [Beijerinckia indica subsp. indica ATCC 9039]ACB94801.1 hydrogenase nickel insertion protein HypA [Beijerinckia indica subsp. indica ATCC 9039]